MLYALCFVLCALCFMLCPPHQIAFGLSNREDCGGRRLWHLLRDTRGAYRAYVGRREGERLLGRPTHRGEDNIK